MTETKREYDARYRREHRAEINARERKKYWDNHARIRAQKRAYQAAHRVMSTAANRRWRAANPERVRVLWRKYRSNRKRRAFAALLDHART